MEERFNSIKKLFTPVEFYFYLKDRFLIDLSRDKKPLHLICCFSGQASNSQHGTTIIQYSAKAHMVLWFT
ncbi:hypothetical protein ACSMDK_09350 [Yersinia enterocolitica]